MLTVKGRAIEIGSRGVVGPISESGCEIRHPVGPISILKKLCHGVNFSSAPRSLPVPPLLAVPQATSTCGPFPPAYNVGHFPLTFSCLPPAPKPSLLNYHQTLHPKKAGKEVCPASSFPPLFAEAGDAFAGCLRAECCAIPKFGAQNRQFFSGAACGGCWSV